MKVLGGYFLTQTVDAQPFDDRRTIMQDLCTIWDRSNRFLNMFKNLILIAKLSRTTATSCVIYLRSFAIWLLDWSYIGRNLACVAGPWESLHRDILREF